MIKPPERTNLTQRDLDLHSGLGISVALLEEAQVRRVDDREARDVLCLNNHHGDLTGIVYPRIDPRTNETVGYRIRRDHPEMENGKPRNKYLSSVDRAHLYFPPRVEALLRDVSATVVIIESEKAALAILAAAHRGDRRVLPLACGGCWGWRGRIGKAVDEHGERVDESGVLPDFDLIEWADRDVAIVFDGNATTNTSINAARRGLAREIGVNRGAQVRCLDLPIEPGVNGPDDFIGKHGDDAFWALLDTQNTVATFKRTDAGNAELFAARHATDVRFDHAAQIWRVWMGHYWAADRDGRVRRMAKAAARARLEASNSITQDTERRHEVKWALQSESKRALDAALTIAQTEPPLAVTGDDWDKHPMLLAVRNGVIDCESGQLRDGRPEDGITRVAPLAYDPEARCPRWDRFMREIFAQHPEIAGYLQRVIGYTLTGITTEQAIWILFGAGANGKSTLIETLMHQVFGADLAWTMPFPSVSWADSTSEYQKAALAGRRFVTSSEVAKQGRLDEELVKSLTGNDSVNARHPYGRPFTFIPSAKCFLRVNDKPQIRDESHGMWRRIKLVPFLETFAIDTTLANQLAAEAPGILNWAIRGCLEWQRDGLGEPEIVKAATAEYRGEQDQINSFIEAKCVMLEGVSVKAGALFSAYKGWADDNVRSEDRLSQTTFGKRMKQRVTANDQGRHTIYYGVALAAEDDERMAA